MADSNKIIVALDYNDKARCLDLVALLDPKKCRLKIGKEMFTLFGPSIVEVLQVKGFDVFLDLKFHDIPNTVAKAVSAAASLGVWMVNVHASGGKRMMLAAQEAIDKAEHKPLLIGVTVLTSFEDNELPSIGVNTNSAEQVNRLAALVNESGLSGVVCSAQEARQLKANFGNKFLTVTPGIRPATAETGDQRRVMTPTKALQNGSDYLVIGRPITQADAPAEALEAIFEEVIGS